MPSKPARADSQHRTSAPRGTVMGLRLDRGRLTWMGWVFIVLIFVLPVMLLGLGLDMLLQWVLGRCLGVWCWFG